MIAALLFAAQAAAAAAPPAPVTAIDAERAFIADAHTTGQWAAFRKWSTDDAVIFDPQPVNAHAALKDAPEPKIAIFWWPGNSYVSCDGNLAVNTGPWVRGGGKRVGFFTTVWRKKDGEWRWIYDGGGDLDLPRPEGGDIKPIPASCTSRPTKAAVPEPIEGFVAPYKTGSGLSADGTLAWHYRVDARGARHFVAQLWASNGWQTVIDDRVPAPPAQ
jgi:hypothetical protein